MWRVVTYSITQLRRQLSRTHLLPRQPRHRHLRRRPCRVPFHPPCRHLHHRLCRQSPRVRRRHPRHRLIRRLSLLRSHRRFRHFCRHPPPTPFPSYTPTPLASPLPSPPPTPLPSSGPSPVLSPMPSSAPTFPPSFPPTPAPSLTPTATPSPLPTKPPTPAPPRDPATLPSMIPTPAPTASFIKIMAPNAQAAVVSGLSCAVEWIARGSAARGSGTCWAMEMVLYNDAVFLYMISLVTSNVGVF